LDICTYDACSVYIDQLTNVSVQSQFVGIYQDSFEMVHTHTQTRTYTHIHTPTRAHTHTHTHAHTHECAHVHTRQQENETHAMQRCTRCVMCVCSCVCVCVCVYMCVFVRVFVRERGNCVVFLLRVAHNHKKHGRTPLHFLSVVLVHFACLNHSPMSLAYKPCPYLVSCL